MNAMPPLVPGCLYIRIRFRGSSLPDPESVGSTAQTPPNLPKHEVNEDQYHFPGHVQCSPAFAVSIHEAPLRLYLLLQNQIEHCI